MNRDRSNLPSSNEALLQIIEAWGWAGGLPSGAAGTHGSLDGRGILAEHRRASGVRMGIANTACATSGEAPGPPGKNVAHASKASLLKEPSWVLPAALGVWLTLAGAADAVVSGVSAGRGGSGVLPPSGTVVPVVGSADAEVTPAQPEAAAISGRVRRADGTGADSVEVRFWTTRDGEIDKEQVTRTDSTGRYDLALPDGGWTGTACSSPAGYLPGLWELTVAGGELSRFQEVTRRAPVIADAGVAVTSSLGVVATGDVVTLTGSGFGCSGHVRVEVDGLPPVEQAVFSRHTDAAVRFGFPALPPPAGGGQVVVRTVRFTYAQGPLQSNTALFQSPLTLDRSGVLQPQVSPFGPAPRDPGTGTPAGSRVLDPPRLRR